MYFHRLLEKPLNNALKHFPVVLISGSRQTGKSTLLQNTLPEFTYMTLDDPLLRELALSDPALFLKTYPPPLIIDEIQYAPSLLSYIKMNVDKDRQTYGQYVLTGSQVFTLMKDVSESLAGRMALFHLYPFSWQEMQNIDYFNEIEIAQWMIRGFYPEFQVQKDLNPKYWHSAYLSTYIERDIRSMRQIQDLGLFQKYLVLLAARAGQMLNINEIAKECGISQTTAKDWLTLLETSAIIHILKPYAKNITKRLVKSPKLFFADTGLLCYLLRVESAEQLIHSPFGGHIFENMMIMEMIKQFTARGERAPCYYYRTYDGSEIDLIIDQGSFIDAFEIKLSSTPKVSMTKSLALLAREHSVNQKVLLNLYHQDLPFSNGTIAKHWSSILKST